MTCAPRSPTADFHVREGQAIGCKAFLRGDCMGVLDRLLATALPRVPRLPRHLAEELLDGRGNYTLGIEQLRFQ